jgi:hypothetical protein
VDVDTDGDEPRKDDVVDRSAKSPSRGPAGWFHNTNHNPDVVGLIRRARKMLPGDPDFGDPLSMSGDGGPQTAARAADRLLRDREAATREVGLATLQVWQALNQRVSGRPVDAEVTIVFTDLVGFSDWSLHAGDEATLRLLRRGMRCKPLTSTAIRRGSGRVSTQAGRSASGVTGWGWTSTSPPVSWTGPPGAG